MLSVKEIDKNDVDLLTGYWLTADDFYLKSMGADKAKLPSKEELIEFITEQIKTPINKKQSYCIIWKMNDKAIGHSNVNKIVFGKEAFMHLHMWDSSLRKKGIGTELVRMTLPYFFEKLQLKKILCEPYSLNIAPNKILEKVGFDFVKQYITTPGLINFEQEVKQWEMSYEKFKML